MDNDSRIKDIIYKRRNGYDIVNDPEAIASCKREQNRDIIDNSRLGSYDKYGNYVIIPEIRRELINMPKLIYNQYTSGGAKVYELKSYLPIFNDIFLKLVISGDNTSLLICEQVNREAGGYLEVYDEEIDSISNGRDDRLPLSIVFRNYNIFDNPNDFGKELKDSKFDNILTRKVYLSLLSKELRSVSTLDEKEAFKNMVSNLKQGGDYGKKVLDEFLSRLKNRPAIFEISKAENYNKAINEVLLSSLEVVTTEEDRQDEQSRQVYFSVLNARDKNIEQDLLSANERVSEEYVKHIVDKAKDDFVNGQEDELSATDEFYAKLSEDRLLRSRTLDKPILKQGKEGKQEPLAETKEERIKQILAQKEKAAKKTPANKKLKASKSKKAVKLKAGKKKSTSKKKTKAKKRVKPKKAKVKSKKKVKKAKPKKKKIAKKKSAKKKVKRKIAKRGLKAKKGKLKGKKKKKFKKPKFSKKAKKKLGKLKADKKSFSKPQKFSPGPKKKAKKNGQSLAEKMNILENNTAPQLQGLDLTYKVPNRSQPFSTQNTINTPNIGSNIRVIIHNSQKNDILKNAPKLTNTSGVVLESNSAKKSDATLDLNTLKMGISPSVLTEKPKEASETPSIHENKNYSDVLAGIREEILNKNQGEQMAESPPPQNSFTVEPDQQSQPSNEFEKLKDILSQQKQEEQSGEVILDAANSPIEEVIEDESQTFAPSELDSPLNQELDQQDILNNLQDSKNMQTPEQTPTLDPTQIQ